MGELYDTNFGESSGGINAGLDYGGSGYTGSSGSNTTKKALGIGAMALGMMTPAGWISTGLTVLGGILSGMTAKTPKVQRSARDSILMTQALRYNKIRKQRESSSFLASMISGMNPNKFPPTSITSADLGGGTSSQYGEEE